MLRPPLETVLCVPTREELDRLRALAPEVCRPGRWRAVEVVGFGPIAAAARAAQLIGHYRPAHLLVAGIAGTYGGAADIGTARVFGSVALDGVGAGEGPAQLLPSAMGFNQWAGVFERLPLADGGGPELLTVCAAAEGEAMLAARRARFPAAVAEDMEAFGVALAASMGEGTEVSVLRGFSNQAGNRDPKTWRIDAALDAVAAELRRALGGALGGA